MNYHRLSPLLLAFLSLPAVAQVSTSPPAPPPESVNRQVAMFNAEAEVAEAQAAAKVAQAKRTGEFIKTLSDRVSTLAVDARPAVDTLIAQLETQRAAEEHEAQRAQTEATTLRVKAQKATQALTALGMRSPDVVAFDADFPAMFDDANAFQHPGKQAPPPGDNTRAAPDEVAHTWAGRVARATGAFLFDRPEATPLSGASLTLGKEDTSLGLKFSFVTAGKRVYCGKTVAGGCDEKHNPITADRGYQRTWSAGLSAAAEDNFGNLFSGGKDGGFGDDIRASFGVTTTYYKKRDRKAMEAAMAAAETALRPKCQSARRTKEPLISEALLRAGCSGDDLRAWAATATAEEDKEAREIFLDALWGSERPVLSWGLSGEAGYKAFSYRTLDSVDPADLDVDAPFGRVLHEPTEFVWQVGGQVGLFGGFAKGKNDPHLFLAVLAEVGEDYDYPKKFKDQTICPVATGDAPFVTCADLNTGPPDKDAFYRVGLQGKLLIPGGSIVKGLGIAPKVTFDVDDNQFAYDVPILFVTDKEGKLNAGIRLSGELGGTEPDDFGVGLFISSAFEVK